MLACSKTLSVIKIEETFTITACLVFILLTELYAHMLGQYDWLPGHWIGNLRITKHKQFSPDINLVRNGSSCIKQ